MREYFPSFRSGMIDQLLSLQLTSYMKKEEEFVPWASAMSKVAYIRGMLSRTGIYGSFLVKIKAISLHTSILPNSVLSIVV